jgi:hypothetical protein
LTSTDFNTDYNADFGPAGVAGQTGVVYVQDVVVAALKKSGMLGLGQAPDGADIVDAQNDLSDMLAQWNVKTWLVWDKVDVGFASTGQAVPYTVGPTGNYQVSPRPDRVEAAYVQIISQSGLPVSQPLDVIPSREGYSRIAVKQLVAFPKAVFLDTSYPTGNLYVYPWPSNGLYIVNLILKNVFPVQLPLNMALNLPPETYPAIKFNLARRLRQAYGKGLKPDPELNALAKDSLATLRNSRIQVPQLVMPSALIRNTGSNYSIYGDNYYS